MPKVLIELFSGLASISNAYHKLVIPCSRAGCKQGYSSAIMHYLGEDPPEYTILVDTDPGLCNALKDAFLDPKLIADRIGWITDAIKNPKHCWDWAKDEHLTNSAAWFLYTAGRYSGIGGWRGSHINRPNIEPGFSPSRKTLRARFNQRWSVSSIEVINSPAGLIEPLKGATVYIDAPYTGTSKYDFDIPEDIEDIALNWSESGSRVIISENHPLTNLHKYGYHSVDITDKRTGSYRKNSKNKTEWLTISPS